ncbi:hypothetical protein HS088_TW19G00613 [Tripterygium wilfordii]|uniref:Succinate dehydrogenase assembly factor 2 mitochondrial n=1 Tax=Tripterygium wilfordii TaxID=458696 RepID=A0A7J7CA82_TRIWF|nr:succinate dehydrogenase assembly factor 2, mitochondrial [Tripterygium wilfordii]KAF5731010.1 hypothetical protein HS088_TW19G00613 [Tripterygium wilfordii]
MASFGRALSVVRRIVNSTAVTSHSSIAPAAEILIRPQYSLVPRYYSASGGDTGSLNIDLSNEENKRRVFNRLVYRSKQRGFLELDLVLGKWVEENVHSMDEKGITALVHVLDLENPDLWKWLTGQEQPPETVSKNPVFSTLHNKVMNNLNSHAAPETRAIPGQPWVRGWDDIKKGRDGPIAGNQ